MDKRRRADEDTDLFRQAVADAQPLEQDRIAPHRRRRRPVPEQRLRDQHDVMEHLLSDHYVPADIETGEELLYVRPGVQHGVMRKLRRGQFAVEAELDLHRHTVAQARELIAGFLHDATLAGRRCVRIIHGKGLGSPHKLPVLKNKVNGWLRQRNEVLAFCSALPNDGGTGAVYVLLRRG